MSKCADRLKSEDIKKQLFEGRDVPNYLVDEIVNEVERIKQSVDKYPQGGTLSQRVSKYLKDRIEYNQTLAAEETSDVLRRKANLQHINQPAFKGNPEQGVMSLLVKQNVLSNNGLLTTENRAMSLKGDWLNGYLGKLEEKKLLPLMLDGATNGMDSEVIRGVYALEKGLAMDGLSDEAKQIAELQHSLGKKMLADGRNADIAIRDIGTYVSSLRSSPEALLSAGYDKWEQMVRALKFDKEKFFGDALGNAEQETKVLKAYFEKASTGELEGVELDNPNPSRNVAEKMKQARALTFLDPVSEDAYRKAFSGKSLLESTISDIMSKSEKLSMVQQFGSKPREEFLKLIEKQAKLLEKEGDVAGARKLIPNPAAEGDLRYSKKLLDQWTVSTGTNAIVAEGGEWVANAERRTLMLGSLSKLGTAGFKSLGNMAQTAALITDQTGKNLFESSLDTLKGFVGSFTSSAQGKKTLDSAGIMLEDTLRQFFAHNLVGVDKMGAQSLSLMSKVNLMHGLTEAGKKVFAEQFMRDGAEQAGKAFLQLDPHLQATFLQAGIKAEDWATLSHAFEEGPRGKMFTPKSIAMLPAEDVAARAKELKLSPEAYTRQMQLQYSAILNSGAMYASTTAGANEKRMAQTLLGLTQPAQAGTKAGALINIMSQFKSFSYQALNNALSSLNSTPSAQALERGVVMSGSKNFATPAYMLASTTALYYLAKSMQDIAKGKNPKDPRLASTWVDAALNSGMGSLYVDLSQRSLESGDVPRTIADFVAGPTLGAPLDVAYDLAHDAKAGKIGSRTKKDATRAIRTNIPFQNAPLFNQAFDYLQYDVLQKSVDPKGYAKGQANLKKFDTADRLPGPFGANK